MPKCAKPARRPATVDSVSGFDRDPLIAAYLGNQLIIKQMKKQENFQLVAISWVSPRER